MAAAPSASVPLQKVEKKIAQISRVIQHLNAKSDDADVADTAGTYENEIEGAARRLHVGAERPSSKPRALTCRRGQMS